MDMVKGIRKCIDYVLDTKSFVLNFDVGKPTDQALLVAKSIRGNERGPAILIHGVMKRSGTVYVGELLGLHPDLYPYPNRVWEIPFLPLTGDICKVQQHFFFLYEQNTDKIGENDFLPLFGSSFIAYLHSFVPEGKRMLLKMPGVQYLNYFFSVFPYENLLILVRDGRDVVTSTVRTWPQIRFSHACQRWDRSAKMILAFQAHNEDSGYWLARFEDAVHDPAAFVKEACRRFGLDESRYPYEKIESIPVQGSSSFKDKEQGRVRYFVPKPAGFKPVGRWQQWSAWQKWIFKRIAGKSLLDLGYCTDLNW